MYSRKIGIIDSGVGGVTVLKELMGNDQNFDIIYIGDSKNIPYGNKNEEKILEMTQRMVSFLLKNNVDSIILACNTISSIKQKIKYENLDLLDIITPTCSYILQNKIEKIGIIGTQFTVKTNMYKEILKNYNVNVEQEISFILAELIENKVYNSEKIEIEIKRILKNFDEKNKNCKNIILGCTHYSIIEDLFKNENSSLNFINPSKIFSENFKKKHSKNNQNINKSKDIKVYTSGNIDVFEKTIKSMNVDLKVEKIEL